MAGMRLRSIAADGALPDSADGRLQRFLDYWRSKCQADRLPHRRDIDPTEIIPLLAAIFLMDVEAGDFRFRLVGQDIVTRYGALKGRQLGELMRSEEHTSELQSLMRNSYAVFCLKKTQQHITKKIKRQPHNTSNNNH